MRLIMMMIKTINDWLFHFCVSLTPHILSHNTTTTTTTTTTTSSSYHHHHHYHHHRHDYFYPNEKLKCVHNQQQIPTRVRSRSHFFLAATSNAALDKDAWVGALS